MKLRSEDISESALKAMARSIRSGLDAFYADPENKRRYEEWKKQREVIDSKP